MDYNNKAALRWMAAAGLAAGIVLVRLYGGAAAGWAGEIFAAQPETTAELAVSALSDALVKGEGWYHALAVWARTILDGGRV